MARHDLHIAVTGLNATDNPGPGVSVLRSLRLHPEFQGALFGLTYDTLDPGIYHSELGLDASFLIPYPSQGAEALLARLQYIHEQVGIDVLIPTLDSELPSLMSLENDLKGMGVQMFIPNRDQFDLRSKSRLQELGLKAGIEVPEGKVVMEAAEMYRIHEEISYPFVVKGVFYGAQVVHTLDEALAAFHHTVAKWGIPVIVQKFHPGEEYDVVAVGDGQGGLAGAVPMKKTFITDKGKGWAGVAVRDPELIDVTVRFMDSTRWKGPCEIEILKTSEPRYYLLEVNPRFPAWTYLSAGAGQNLPYAVAQLAAGEDIGDLPDYRAGTLFIRISIDQIATMDDFQQIATTGELHRKEDRS